VRLDFFGPSREFSTCVEQIDQLRQVSKYGDVWMARAILGLVVMTVANDFVNFKKQSTFSWDKTGGFPKCINKHF